LIGPIGKDGTAERKHADLLLHSLVKHVLESDEFNYKVKRADEDADPGMIGDRVVTDIVQAPLVVADLTDLNANAFYELGIRHSTELPTIHVAKLDTVLPFDNVTHRTIFVDLTDWHSLTQARTRLAESLRAIRTPGYKVSNPITQANASFKMRQSEDPRERLIAEMYERISSLEAHVASSAKVSRRKRVSEKIEDDFFSELKQMWDSGTRSPEIEIAAVRLAKGFGIRLSDVSMDGSTIRFQSPQTDTVGLDLDWEQAKGST
jgi:hypothetical protein